MPLGRRLEESTAEVLHSARTTDVDVHVLPIRYGLTCIGPERPRNRTKLMIVDRDVHTPRGQHQGGFFKLNRIVHRVDPQNIQIARSEAEHLETHQRYVLYEWQVTSHELSEFGEALIRLFV